VEKVMGHKYPYNIGAFFENLKEYGPGPALFEDLSRTREHAAQEITDALLKAVLGIAVAVATPVAVYRFIKDDYQLRKSEVKEGIFHADQKVRVRMRSSSDCDAPEILRRGVIVEYLGEEDIFRGRIKPPQVERKYLVQLVKDGQVTCFQSNLERAANFF
jgi:hypothetical protein